MNISLLPGLSRAGQDIGQSAELSCDVVAFLPVFDLYSQFTLHQFSANSVTAFGAAEHNLTGDWSRRLQTAALGEYPSVTCTLRPSTQLATTTTGEQLPS